MNKNKKLETHRQVDPTTNCEGTVVRLIGREVVLI